MTADVRTLHPSEDVTLDPADIRWRVGQISKKDPHKGSLLGYIDARTCMEALDRLDPEWSAVHGDPIIVGGELVGVPCRVTVNGVTRSDVGMPSSQEPIKGAYSDALKRAAVHFGIGRELYELPRIYVKLDDYKKPVAIPTYRNGRWTLPAAAGSVFYDREPDDQPEQRRGGSPSSPNDAAPVQRTPEEQALLSELLAMGLSHARMSLLADAVQVPKGQHATADQLRRMIAIAQQPLPTPAETVPGPAGQGAGHPDTPAPDSDVAAVSVPAEARSEPASSPPAGAAPAAPTDAEILAAAGEGAELVEPSYAADPDGYKAWYDALPSAERAALRGQGRSPRQLADAAKQARPDAEQLRSELGS